MHLIQKKKSTGISVGEKIGYSLGDLSANLVFQTLITYLAYFYTDIYGLKSTDASLIMLVVGLTAAFVFNPIVGLLADRTNSRWGKFRPWILFTAIPLGVMAILAFSTPEFAYKGKLMYAAVTYTLLLTLYASSNLPYSALSGVITGDMNERNSLSSYRFVAVMFAQFFVQVFMLPVIEFAGAGNKAAGIEIVMVWLSVTGTVLLLITFFTTKERVVPVSAQKSSLKEDLTDLLSNRPWLIMLCLTILVFITLAMKGGSYVYYFNNYVDRVELQAFISPVVTAFSKMGISFLGADPVSAGFGLFNAGGIIFMIAGISVSAKLANKYGKREVYKYGLLAATLFVLVFVFFKPDAILLMFTSQMLHGFTYGITIPILWAMIADVADYSEWKSHRRATAIIFSAIMVGLKAGLSIGGALVAWILGLFGYVSYESVIEGRLVVQPDSVAEGAKLLVSVFPSIPFLLGFGLLFLYAIDKKMEVEIESELKKRRTNGF
jgi:Na+/melibiose symporter-like transporter